MNRVELSAKLGQSEAVRYTPAGVPILHVRLLHESDVLEADVTRRIKLDIVAIALGDVAETLATYAAGQAIRLEGFLAPKRLGSDQLVLHVQNVARAD